MSSYVLNPEEDCDLCGEDNTGTNLRKMETGRDARMILCLSCAMKWWAEIANLQVTSNGRRVHAKGSIH